MTTLPVFIPSKGRHDRVRTLEVFPQATVVVHDHAELRRYQKCYPSVHIEVSNTPGDAYGLTRQREWICKNLVRKGDWLVFADDNIRYLQALVEPYYSHNTADVTIDSASRALWRSRFNVKCSGRRFLQEIAPDTISHCEKIGAHLSGFSLTDNVLFRRRKFMDCSYVIGKLMVWHNTLEIPFCHEISMEDFYHTAMHLKKYGACVVNQYCHPQSSHYQKGGMGTYIERIDTRRRDVRLLMERFAGMFAVREREGFERGTDLRLRLTSAKQLSIWRLKQFQKRLV